MALWLGTFEGKSRFKSLYDLMGLIPIGLAAIPFREIRDLISYTRIVESGTSVELPSFAK